MSRNTLIIRRSEAARQVLNRLNLDFRVSKLNPVFFVIKFVDADSLVAYKHDVLGGLGCIQTKLKH